MSTANRINYKAHYYYLFKKNESHSKIQGQRLRILSESIKTLSSKDVHQQIKFVLHPDPFHAGIINSTAHNYNHYICTSAKSIWNFSQFKQDSPKKFQLPKMHRRFSSKASNDDSKTEIQNSASHNKSLKDRTANSRIQLQSGPSLSDFLQHPYKSTSIVQDENDDTSYFDTEMFNGNNRSVFIETYGCQMNVNDTEIAWGILQKNGFSKASNINEADAVLVVTCAIREGAEEKIWSRLRFLRSIKLRRSKDHPLKIGILGCMAERLKHKILEREKMVDIVCGPDAYRDLPRLLAISDAAAVNVQLSLEETYADVIPVRHNPNSPSAFVSIMRGCDNMCTYCIVPFTRGRERSRPFSSILNEIQILSDQGVKDVTLLGQNVNSYRDMSVAADDEDSVMQLSAGFKTVYKPKSGGYTFSKLLKSVAEINPEMRIRFTSPHPKDFPDNVLHTILAYPNVCKQIHLPAQSGNSDILAAMGRGYTREAYIDLVNYIRKIIPDVALSSDFISGFCGETEKAHEDTLSLMDIVRYNTAFCFPYSMRQKTRAHHRLDDNVPKEVKNRRHMELHDRYRMHAEALHLSQVGQQHLVLVEGESKRSPEYFAGRNDANTKVIFPEVLEDGSKANSGDYIVVEITSGTSLSLKGKSLYKTTLQDFSQNQGSCNNKKQKETTV
ncbi:mitochondrial tRNA methylthiotransferase CDK5RAP1-like isoform X2 [Physella acuta]|nr:mitochondrial tRNA methylthiotransferase CDK5RAP1-like isoform X2 [Physella acuta]